MEKNRQTGKQIRDFENEKRIGKQIKESENK